MDINYNRLDNVHDFTMPFFRYEFLPRTQTHAEKKEK